MSGIANEKKKNLSLINNETTVVFALNVFLNTSRTLRSHNLCEELRILNHTEVIILYDMASRDEVSS